MTNTAQVSEKMKVIGSDGQHIGTVDKIEGNQIKLTRNDPAAQGQHHFIPMDWVDEVLQNEVHLSISSQEAKRDWQSEQGQNQTNSTSSHQAVS